MASASVEQRVDALRRELEHHNHLYYVQARPQISDREYDRLMSELIELETAHPELRSDDSPTQRVGGAPIDGFAVVEHAVPMMSIDNTYNEAELRAFDERVRKGLGGEMPTYVLEPKVDGVAVSLRYEKGLLTQAATRGDGRRGDDITANARTIRGIPLRLFSSARSGGGQSGIPDVLEVRGEIYMPNDVFQKINQQRKQAGEELFANPRNFTAGTLKQLDPRVTARRQLRFVSHGIGQVVPSIAESYWEIIKSLQDWRLPVGEHLRQVQSVDEALIVINEFAKLRGTLAYQTDGMVMKVDSFVQREKLGQTSKSPRWVIAYKYPAEQVQTVLRAVDWQVGKGGTLTPVARLDPVFVAGTTVSNATLHNIEQIEKKDLHVGDTIVLEKAGEVIPQVVQAVTENRPKNARPIAPPRECPSCGSAVEKEADTPYIRCVNPACPAQFKERLRWFCARNQMDIENLGDALVEQLVDAGLVKTFADLYRLKKADLLKLERMGEKSAQNVIDAIEQSRSRGLDRLLAGLGVRHVGNRVAHVLASHFGSLEALGQAAKEQLSAVHEIGDVIADSVHDFFHNQSGRETIEQLRAMGIDPKMRRIAPDATELPLAGQSVVVTGTLEKFDRGQIEQLIVSLGGKASSSVSKKTSFLIAGESAGSKMDKARQLGVPVLSEAEFLTRIGRSDNEAVP